MAIRWNSFFTRESKREQNTKKEESRTMTEQDIRNMVNQEVSAASMKQQVISYMEDVNSQGIRTEALLSEIRDAVDNSIRRIEEMSQNNDEIEASIKRVGDIGEEIKNSVHKDNLLTYKNIKLLFEEAEERRIAENKKIKRAANAAVVLSAITLAILIGAAAFAVVWYFLFK